VLFCPFVNSVVLVWTFAFSFVCLFCCCVVFLAHVKCKFFRFQISSKISSFSSKSELNCLFFSRCELCLPGSLKIEALKAKKFKAVLFFKIFHSKQFSPQKYFLFQKIFFHYDPISLVRCGSLEVGFGKSVDQVWWRYFCIFGLDFYMWRFGEQLKS